MFAPGLLSSDEIDAYPRGVPSERLDSPQDKAQRQLDVLSTTLTSKFVHAQASPRPGTVCNDFCNLFPTANRTDFANITS